MPPRRLPGTFRLSDRHIDDGEVLFLAFRSHEMTGAATDAAQFRKCKQDFEHLWEQTEDQTVQLTAASLYERMLMWRFAGPEELFKRHMETSLASDLSGRVKMFQKAEVTANVKENDNTVRLHVEFKPEFREEFGGVFEATGDWSLTEKELLAKLESQLKDALEDMVEKCASQLMRDKSKRGSSDAKILRQQWEKIKADLKFEYARGSLIILIGFGAAFGAAFGVGLVLLGLLVYSGTRQRAGQPQHPGFDGDRIEWIDEDNMRRHTRRPRVPERPCAIL